MEKREAIVSQVFLEMLKVNVNDKHRIEHSVKMHNYARQIGVLEKLDSNQFFVLELTAILHDIGIQVSLKKYNSSSAKYQQQEGPSVAKAILDQYDLPLDVVERVCYIIAHHHTFTAVDDKVFQVIIESDFLVNAVEEGYSSKQIKNFSERYFKTNTGQFFLQTLVEN